MARQHSTRGIASLILALVGCSPFAMTLIMIATSKPAGSQRGPGPGFPVFVPVGPLILALIIFFVLPLPFLLMGLVLGSKELKRDDRKKFFPLAGILVSAPPLLFLGMAYLWLLNIALSQSFWGTAAVLLLAFGVGSIILGVWQHRSQGRES
jgi:hypothetical protein